MEVAASDAPEPRVDPRGEDTGDDAAAASTPPAEVPTTERGLMAALAQGWRELCWLLLLVLLSGWAALQQSGLPPRTRSPNPPVHFFYGGGHLVQDFYQGQLAELRLSDHDVSFLFYYAPWDRDSMRARDMIAELSRKWYKQVHFAAVNCWWPEGECRRSYHPSSYPVIALHVRGVGNILYRGPLFPAQHLEQFLMDAMRPLAYLTTAEQMGNLLRKHSAVVVAILEEGLPASPLYESSGYRQYDAFYVLATLALKNDPLREVAFAVVTNAETAQSLCFSDSLAMYSWNSSLAYNGDWADTGKILSWIYKNLRLAVHWLSPSGVKSLALSQVVENSSTLILYAPRPSWEYALLQEVAREYYSCGDKVLWGLGAPLRGMGCSYNGTLRFLAIDSDTYEQFVPPGVLVPGVQRSVAIIYAAKKEEEYVLESPVSRASLQQFVLDFTSRSLRRHLRSEDLPSCSRGAPVCKLNGVALQHLLTKDVSQDLFVLFCASWCGFCKTAVHFFEAAARAFAGTWDILFARIDASKNDLPWEFTMERYPTIIFFPAHRRSESSVYRERPLTELGLVQFVLGRAQPPVVLAGALALCTRSRACILRNLVRVAHRVLCLPEEPWEKRRQTLRKARKMRDQLTHALLLHTHHTDTHSL
ncbi:thioredoxin domain-containing protein 11-like [Ornithodoros turicata]|uniref:thioredoxin domain-containing protein 11-like n=1 Tax=Ornithodoros turicata TaxID=34597 RepID=UPI0031388DF9